MQKGDIFPIDSKPFLSLLPGGDSVLVHFRNKSIQVKRSRWMRTKNSPDSTGRNLGAEPTLEGID